MYIQRDGYFETVEAAAEFYRVPPTVVEILEDYKYKRYLPLKGASVNPRETASKLLLRFVDLQRRLAELESTSSSLGLSFSSSSTEILSSYSSFSSSLSSSTI